MSYIFFKGNFFVTNRVRGVISREEARETYNRAGKDIYVVDNEMKPNFVLTLTGVHPDLDWTEWSLDILDGNLRSAATFTYNSGVVRKSKDTFFLTRAILKDWDENKELHGRTPAFCFAEIHRGLGIPVSEWWWEILKKIKFYNTKYTHGFIDEQDRSKTLVEVPYPFDTSFLQVKADFDHIDDIIEHSKKVLPYLHKIMEQNP